MGDPRRPSRRSSRRCSHRRAAVAARGGATGAQRAHRGDRDRMPLPGRCRGRGSFWRLLRDGVDAMREVPASGGMSSACTTPTPSARQDLRAQAGFLEQVDQFDPQFFGISPREAQAWIRSSGCCWRWRGRRSSTPGRRRTASAAARSASSSASRPPITRRCRSRRRSSRASTPTRPRASRTAWPPAASPTCSGCRARA